jgi:phosphoribosylformylglycinamidine synthase
VYYQFAQAIKGMGEACRKFDTPVTGGNVSFYNQANIKDKVVPVYPTPTIGMLGILDDAAQMMTLDFKSEGDHIYLVGRSRNDLGSSEYLRTVHGVEFSACPYFDLEEEFFVQKTVSQLIQEGLVQSAHDVSEGGLFVALTESAMPRGLGFAVENKTGIRHDAWLFGEAQGRIVVSVAADQQPLFDAFMDNRNAPFEKLGVVQGANIRIDGADWGAIAEWQQAYDTVLENIMD